MTIYEHDEVALVREAVKYYISILDRLAAQDRAELGNGQPYAAKATTLRGVLAERVWGWS